MSEIRILLLTNNEWKFWDSRVCAKQVMLLTKLEMVDRDGIRHSLNKMRGKLAPYCTHMFLYILQALCFLMLETTCFETINPHLMSGLLNKLTDQLSGQSKQQGSSSSGGLLHKITDAATGQKHPQEYQNQPSRQGSGYGYGAGQGPGPYQ